VTVEIAPAGSGARKNAQFSQPSFSKAGFTRVNEHFDVAIGPDRVS